MCVYKPDHYTKDTLGRSNSACDDLKAEIWLMWSRHDQKTGVAGLEWAE